MSEQPATRVRPIVGLILCFVPMICLYLSPWSSGVPLLYLGILPAIVAMATSVRVAAGTAVLTPISVFVGILVSGSVWGAAAFIAAVCLGVAWSYTRGWEGASTYVASQAALAAIAAPASRLVDAPSNSVAAAAVVAAFVFAGGVWVALVGAVLLRDLPHREHPRPTQNDLYRFGVTLVLLAILGTVAAKLWLPGGHAWWVLLTLLVVLQPGVEGTTRRTLYRVLGTVGGGLVAAVLVHAIGMNTLSTAIGVVLAVLSGIAYLKAPYWAFAALLTAALMCLSFTPETVLHGYAERAGFTLLAAAAVMAVLWATDYVLTSTATSRTLNLREY